jgi:hypothetical protein
MTHIDPALLTFEIIWKPVRIPPPEGSGWYIIAMSNKNFKESGHSKKWRDSFGFNKAWFHGSDWWVADHHGCGSERVTDRVTHWDYCPSVPDISEEYQQSNP